MCLCDTQIQPQLALLAYFGTFWETMQGFTCLGHPVYFQCRHLIKRCTYWLGLWTNSDLSAISVSCTADKLVQDSGPTFCVHLGILLCYEIVIRWVILMILTRTYEIFVAKNHIFILKIKEALHAHSDDCYLSNFLKYGLKLVYNIDYNFNESLLITCSNSQLWFICLLSSSLVNLLSVDTCHRTLGSFWLQSQRCTCRCCTHRSRCLLQLNQFNLVALYCFLLHFVKLFGANIIHWSYCQVTCSICV